MKKVTLAMFLALFGAVGAQATETWEEPTLNTTTFANGDTVYFYNVATKSFLAAGNAYGTQASINMNPIPFAPLKQDNGGYYMWNKNSKGWKKMFADNYTTFPGAAYVDEASQGKDTWFFFPKDDGSMEIAFDTTKTAEMGETRMGWDGGDNTIARPVLDMACDTASKFGIVWKTISYKDASVPLYVSRTALSKAMTKAQNAGLSIGSYLTIYNNSASTSAEIDTAATELIKKVNAYGLNGASDENPKDATGYITAYDCSTLTGWTCVASANAWQTQTNSECSTGNAAFSQPYIERYISSNTGTLSDGKIYQTITDLPNGSYTIGVSINAANQATGKNAETGTYVFAKSGSNADSIVVSTVAGTSKRFTITTVVTDGTLTFGFEMLNTSCNWVGMDNWTLTYYGNGTGTLKSTLNTNIETATTLAETSMNEEVLNDLTTAIDNAQSVYDVTDATADEITAQISALSTAIKAAQDNISAYAAFKVAIDSANNVISNYDANVYSTEALSDFLSENSYQDCYDGYTLSTDSCTKATAIILAKVKETIYSGIQEGNDITYIITNPNFTSNASGWSGTTPSASYKVAEVYNTTFDTYQTLTDLPLGKYTLKVQGFTRTQSNATAYANYIAKSDKVNAMIYANNATDTINNIMAEAQATSLMNDSLGTATGYGTYPNDFVSAGGTYTPNSMQGGYYYFSAGLYDNTVSTVVTDGTLKIGIKLSDKTGYSDFWTLFDNFRLTYDGKSIETLSGLRDATIAKAEALYTEPMCADSLNALKSIVSTAKAETDGDKLLTELADMSDCISAANSSISTYATLTSYMEYSKQITDSLKRTAGASDYASAYSTIEGNISAGNYQDSEIPAAIITAKKATHKYLMSDIATTETADGVDVTFVIRNAEFASNTSTGWDTSKTPGLSYQCAEFYNTAFDMSQTLYNMPQGTYKLTTQGYYRDGANAGLADSVASTYGLNAKLYINDVIGNVMPITDGAIDTTGTGCPTGVYLFNTPKNLLIPNNMQTAAFYFDSLTVAGQQYLANDTYNSVTTEVKSDANNTIKIGIKKSQLVADDWAIFGGFKLYYYGTSTGMDATTNGSNASVVESKYYSVGGTQNSKLQQGVNIVKSTMSDGSVKVKTVIVK